MSHGRRIEMLFLGLRPQKYEMLAAAPKPRDLRCIGRGWRTGTNTEVVSRLFMGEAAMNCFA